MLSEQAVCWRTAVNRCSVYSSVFAVSSVLGLFGLAESRAGANPIPDQFVQTSSSVIYVNPTIGNDNASGQAQTPLKTITVALDRAMPNSVILLAPGTYSVQTGEVFPIQLKPTVTLQGDPRDRGQNVIIRGGDFFLSRSFARQNVTVLGANQATLTGVTVTNPNPQGYGLWTESASPLVVANTFTGSTHDGASIVGDSSPTLRNNYFYQNGANGITIYGTSRPQIQDNIFEQTGFGVNIAQNAAPKIVGNRITQNKDGVVVQGNAQPFLRSNVIDNNYRDGIVSIAQSRPNLGDSSDPGNNTFLNNRQFDINAQRTAQNLPAFGNQLSAKTIGRLDFSGLAATEITTNVASSTGYGQARPMPPLTIPRRTQFRSSGAINIPVPAPMSRALPQLENSSPIDIPVATPVTRSAPLPLVRSNRPLPMLQFNAATRPNTAIPIQVPQGESSIARQPYQPSSQLFQQPIQRPYQPSSQLFQQPIQRSPYQPSRPSQASRRSGTLAVLPVPRTMPPIGNTKGTSVRVWRGGSSSVSQATSRGYRFRVVVQAYTESAQAQVRSLVADAFSLRGRSVMQAGAFRTRMEADELLQVLLSQGLQASIEQI